MGNSLSAKSAAALRNWRKVLIRLSGRAVRRSIALNGDAVGRQPDAKPQAMFPSTDHCLASASRQVGHWLNLTARPARLHAARQHLSTPSKPMPSQCPTCRGRGTIRILSAEPEPPQIVPCTRCGGTGHNKPATPSPMHDKALRPNNRKSDSVKEWFDLWRNPR